MILDPTVTWKIPRFFDAGVVRLTPTVLPAIHYFPQGLHSNRVRIWAWVRRLHGVASLIKLVGFNHTALYRRKRVLLTKSFTTHRLWSKQTNTYALCKLKWKEKPSTLLRISGLALVPQMKCLQGYESFAINLKIWRILCKRINGVCLVFVCGCWKQ
jgi:hypothetical protein